MALTEYDQQFLAKLNQSPTESSGQGSLQDIINTYSSSPRDISQRQPAGSQRVRTALQGLTFGFSDEIEAAIRSLGGGEGQTYEAIRDDIRNKLQAYKEQNPTEAITYETMGALAPTAVALLSGVGTGAGAANVARLTGQAGRLARTGTGVLPQAATLGGRLPRFAQGAATGAAYGGLYGVGTGEGTLGERVAGAGSMAGAGAAFGVGGQLLAKTVSGISRPIVNLFSKANTEQSGIALQNEVNKAAKSGFVKIKEQGGTFSSREVKPLIDDLKNEIQETYGWDPATPRPSSERQALITKSFKDIDNVMGTDAVDAFDNELLRRMNSPEFQSKLQGTVLDARGRPVGVTESQRAKLVNDLREEVASSMPKGKETFDLEELYELKKSLSRNYRNSQSMGLPQPAINDMIRAIEDMVENVGEGSANKQLWDNAKELWRTKSNFDMMAEELDKAKRTAQQRGYGTDKVAVYKGMFNSILNSPRKSRFLRPEDREAMSILVQGDLLNNILQAAGRFAPTASNSMRLLAVGSAMYSGGMTIPLTIFTSLAKRSSSKSMQENAEKILDIILSNDPVMIRELGDAFRPITQQSQQLPPARTALGARLAIPAISE